MDQGGEGERRGDPEQKLRCEAGSLPGELARLLLFLGEAKAACSSEPACERITNKGRRCQYGFL